MLVLALLVTSTRDYIAVAEDAGGRDEVLGEGFDGDGDGGRDMLCRWRGRRRLLIGCWKGSWGCKGDMCWVGM